MSTDTLTDGQLVTVADLDLEAWLRGDGTSSRSPAATTLPRRSPRRRPPHPRAIAKVRVVDVGVLIGCAVSAVCSTMLLFGRLASLSGWFGFVLVAYGIFLATYAVALSSTERRPAIVDRLMTVLLATATVVAAGALVSVVGFTLWRGKNALTRWNLYTQDMSATGPLDPLSSGGIAHALVGTLIMISIALAVTVPLGLTCAIFLNEVRGRPARVVRTVVDAMTALPSILAGLFIFATWILILGFERSGLAASIAISIMMLPIVIRSSDLVIRLVPGNLREAAAALGAPTWRSVRYVVLPTARSGLATSVILGVARGVGETAPVLLTAGFTATMNVDPRRNPMVSLPLATYEFVRSPQPEMVARGFATAAVLMVLVLALFSVARIVGGRPAGRLSGRQARRAAQRSLQDLARLEQRARHAEDRIQSAGVTP